MERPIKVFLTAALMITMCLLVGCGHKYYLGMELQQNAIDFVTKYMECGTHESYSEFLEKYSKRLSESLKVRMQEYPHSCKGYAHEGYTDHIALISDVEGFKVANGQKLEDCLDQKVGKTNPIDVMEDVQSNNFFTMKVKLGFRGNTSYYYNACILQDAKGKVLDFRVEMCGTRRIK